MATEKTTTRTRRTPINGVRNKLNVRGQEPGYVYRIVNDIEDRVQTLQEMGYEIVTDKGVTVGDKRIANPTQEGSPVKVSVGQGVQAYVMRQKQEWFDEDQKAKNARNDELEAQMKRDANEAGFYGKLKIGEK
jgi:hypothetical protein